VGPLFVGFCGRVPDGVDIVVVVAAIEDVDCCCVDEVGMDVAIHEVDEACKEVVYACVVDATTEVVDGVVDVCDVVER
jgi:hypothetical protein